MSVCGGPGDLDAAGGYARGFLHHDENLVLLERYAARFAESLARRGAHSLLSLGVGHQVVSQRLGAALGSGLARYTVVEASAARIGELRASGALAAGVELVQAWFEEYKPPAPVDAVEMGFVLEHVADPGLVLARYRGFLAPGGFIGIAVPNARSLHRLVGHAAGLLDDLYRLSEHDLELGHRRYYDRALLSELVAACGLRVAACEGLQLKALTTAQLASLRLPAAVQAAFCELAAPYPDIANAIYLEACA